MRIIDQPPRPGRRTRLLPRLPPRAGPRGPLLSRLLPRPIPRRRLRGARRIRCRPPPQLRDLIRLLGDDPLQLCITPRQLLDQLQQLLIRRGLRHPATRLPEPRQRSSRHAEPEPHQSQLPQLNSYGRAMTPGRCPRAWRHLDFGRWQVQVRAGLRRLHCPSHGVRVEAVCPSPGTARGSPATFDADPELAEAARLNPKGPTSRT